MQPKCAQYWPNEETEDENQGTAFGNMKVYSRGEEIVDAQLVMKVIAANVDNVRKLIVETIKQMSSIDWSDIVKQNKV